MIHRWLPLSLHLLLRSTLRRAWWAALALIHVAPLVGAMQALIAGGLKALEFSALASAAALWLALAFFTLKCFDAPFLRLRFKRSSVLAFVLVCAVAHEDLTSASASRAMLGELPTAAATTITCALLAQSVRLFPQALHHFAAALRSKLLKLYLIGLVAADHLADQLRPARLLATSPRAPPA